MARATVARRLVLLAGAGMAARRRARQALGAIAAGTDRVPAQCREAHVEFLRMLRRRGRSLAAARQLPGTSDRENRASHVADQYRPLSPFDAGGARLRVSIAAAAHRTPLAIVRHAGTLA